jgi:hypothetical protein
MATISAEDTAKARAYLKGDVLINAFYEDQFKRFFTSYSRAFGKLYSRKGSLFQAKFKRVILRDRERLLDKLLYVHHNPIHHRFYDNYTDWPHSSYQAFFQMGNGIHKPYGVFN